MEKEAPVSSRPPRLKTQGFRQSHSCVIGEELWRWYCSTRSANGGKLSKAMVQARAKWAFHQAGMVDFKASDGWYRRWIHRWRNSNTTTFETENVVVQQTQQTEQTKQTDWEETKKNDDSSSQQQQQPPSKRRRQQQQTPLLEPEPIEVADTESNMADTRSEEEMLDYWSTFLNCNTNFGNVDSDQSQNCGDVAGLFDDADFPIDMDELASAFLAAEGPQFEAENDKRGRPRKRGERYLPRFKEKVIGYISGRNVKAAAEKYRVHAETVTRWRRDGLSPAVPARPSPARPSPDVQLLAWLRRCRVRQIGLTPDELRNKVNQFADRGNTEASPRWFVMWTERLGKELIYEEGMELLDRQSRNIQYPEAFKREVAAFAETKSQISVAKLFNVSRRRVSEWTQIFAAKPDDCGADVDQEKEEKKKKKTVFRITDPEIDRELWVWYQSQTPRPNSNQVRARGVEMYHSRGYVTMSCSHGWYRRWSARHDVALCHGADDQILQWALTQLEANQTLTQQSVRLYALKLLEGKQADFKASSGWVLRFCRRHPDLLQSAPTLATPLPPPLLAKVGRFRRLVQSLARTLTPDVIGNVDELHVTFASRVADAAAGRGRPLLRRPPMAKCHATVVLACLADGNMLPPAVILKGGPGEVLPAEASASNLLVMYQEEARLDDRCMARWLSRVWFDRVPTPNLLLADCYPPHCTPAVKRLFAGHGSTLKVISGGCASKLQPLDVSVKNIFHNLMEKQWEKVNIQPSTGLGSPWDNVGKFEMPSLTNILEWVNCAYENIQTTKQETIRRSYLVTGLTVSANHSEDHFIDNLSMMPRDVVE